MKKSLRYFALLLAFVMIFAAVPFTASAKTISQMKIIAFGDSLTHYGKTSTGTYDEYGNLIYNGSYPEYLSNLLGTEVLNAGVGGNTTDMGVVRLKKEVLDENPDLVLICLGMNDQAYAVGAKAVLTPIERYRANLEYFAQQIQAIGADVVFVTPNPVCTESGYYKDGAEYTYNNGQLPLYCDAMREVAVKYGCGLVDIFYEFSVLPKMGPYMGSGDGIHQNDAGRQLYAQLIAEYINAVYGTASKASMKLRCVDNNNRLLKEYTINGAAGAAVTVPSPEVKSYTTATADVKTTFVNGATHTFTYSSDLEKLISKAESINRTDYDSSVLTMLDSELSNAKALFNASTVDTDAMDASIVKINNLLATKDSGELILSLGAAYEASEFTYNNYIYADDGIRLTDGAKAAPSGASSLYSAWQSNATVIIDLGGSVESDVFRGYFACTTGWGIKNPTGMTVYYQAENNSWVKINGKLEIKRLIDEATNENGTWSVDQITVTANTPVNARKIKFEIPRNGGFIWVDEMEVAVRVGNASQTLPESDNLALYKPYTADGIYTANGSALYPDENGDSLTDGVVADLNAGYDNFAFVGFNTQTDFYSTNGYAAVTVDLGETESIGTFVARVSSANDSNTGAGVAVLSKVEFYVSDNGSTWTKAGEAAPAAGESDTNATLTLSTPVSGRYIQYRFTSNKSWMMVSEVEAYSKVKGDIPVIPDPTVKIGDINGNGEIDAVDYTMLKRAYFGIYSAEVNVGDINGNEEIDAVDYTMLKRVYFGIYQIQ